MSPTADSLGSVDSLTWSMSSLRAAAEPQLHLRLRTTLRCRNCFECRSGCKSSRDGVDQQ